MRTRLVVGLASLCLGCSGTVATTSASVWVDRPEPQAPPTPPMTAQSWTWETDPGWHWVALPVEFRFGGSAEEPIAVEIIRWHGPRQVRAVILWLDATELGVCAIDSGRAIRATAEHRELIERTGRIPLRRTERVRVYEIGAWLVRLLEAHSFPGERIRVETNPLLEVGDAPADTLILPSVTTRLLVRTRRRTPPTPLRPRCSGRLPVRAFRQFGCPHRPRTKRTRPW